MSALGGIVRELLAGDAAMQAALPGGIYAGGEISRQETPAAFDPNGELLPCAVVRVSSDVAAGPYRRGAQAFVSIYFYQRAGVETIDAALARAFELLHESKPAAGIWAVTWADDIPDQGDPVLQCRMAVSRYQVTRLR